MATYYMRADGTAANKAAAIGPASDAAACMNVTVHNAESFDPGDTISVSGLGGVYRSAFYPKAGTIAGDVTYVGADSPIFSGADLLTGWSASESVLDTLGSPVSGAAFDCNADGRIVFSYTAEITANKNVSVDFRREGTTDKVQLDTGWTTLAGIKLKYNDGTWHDVATVSGILTDGVAYEFEIIYSGTSIIVNVDGVEKINTTLDFNTSIAAGAIIHTLVTNDIELTSYSTGVANVWTAALATDPRQLWVDGTFGDRQSSSALTNDFDWYWDDATDTLYLYDSTGDPDSRSSPGVEVCIRQNACVINDRSYITLDGISFERAYNYGINANGASHVTVQNCTLQWNWLDGCLWNSSATNTSYSDIVVENCVARYNGTQGISFTLSHVLSSDNTVRYNTVYENGRHQFANPIWVANHEYTGGIKFVGSAGSQRNVVEYNEVYDNGPLTGAYRTGQGSGIWFDYALGSSGNENHIRYNVIYGNSGNPIYNEVSSYCWWYYNVCYDNARDVDSGIWSVGNIRCDTRAGYDSSYNKFYGNTFYGGLYGILCLSTDQTAGTELNNNEFKNNILANITNEVLYADRGGDNDGANGTGNVYSANCFGAEAANFIWWDGANYSTYDAWAAATDRTENPDNHIESDPGLEAPASDQYWLGTGSPCIGAGVDLGDDFKAALDPASTWPDGVLTIDQDRYGWNIGAYGLLAGDAARHSRWFYLLTRR